jgi:putrescine---pyruvate transaminase
MVGNSAAPITGPETAPTNGLNGYWPPFSSLATRAQNRVPIVRGSGAAVWDADGNEYLDASAALWYANVGHGRREIADAVHAQLSELAAYSNFGDYTTESTERLTARVTALAPVDDPLMFLTSGGSDAVDSAVKIVRRYWTLAGQPGKSGIISRDMAYHGMHGFGTALAGIDANSSGYGPSVTEGFALSASNDADDLERVIRELGPENLAAIFVEPVIGAGGVIPPAPGYLKSVQALCDSYNLLMVADEVITGFGRLGTWFACERFELRPDLLLVAKGITSGYLPLGGVIASHRIWEAFRDAGTVFRHGYTYSGHATACAAANANLDIIESENLLENVQRLEPILGDALAELTEHDNVREIRHIGLLAAVQLEHPDPAFGDRVVVTARRNGLLTRALPRNGLQISPPFVITEAQIATIPRLLATAIDQAAAG